MSLCTSFFDLGRWWLVTLVLPVSLAGATDTLTSSRQSRNPIYRRDAPDPGVVREGGAWYVYHTGAEPEGAYPILKSDNLTTWTEIGHIFPGGKLPVWASSSSSWWAPEVHKVNGRYIAYFTTRQDVNNKFAVGAATSAKPEGPFTDVGAPVATDPKVGLIDVTYFKDPTTSKDFLLWKEDRNDLVPQEPTPIMLQEMKPDGITTVGLPQKILENDLDWEGVLVEAPTMVFRNGYYYLLYSANGFDDDRYAVGVARSEKLAGPYVKLSEPILKSDSVFDGPGHQFVIPEGNDVWHMFYHSRVRTSKSRSRYLMHDVIQWDKDGWPRIKGGVPGR